MRYIIYCRKSTDTEDKQVQSLESQESELRSLAEKLGLNVVEVLLESKSAKHPGRPVFAHMLELITTNKADAILCWKLDRLARNFIDAGAIIHSLQSNIIKEIRTANERHLPTDNVLALSVQLGMANQYIRDLSENVKRGNRAKLEKGEWPNHAPFGYLNDKNTKQLVLDPERAPYVRRMFELYTTEQYSLKEISDTLYREGLRTKTGNKVYRSTIHRILGKRIYYGMLERNGKHYPGKHEPIVTQELFDRAQDVMHGVSRPRKQKHHFALRGILSCDECPCACTMSIKKGHLYTYCTNGKGICTQHKHYSRVDRLHTQIAEILGLVRFDEELIELSYLAAKEKYAHTTAHHEEAHQRLEKQLSMLLEREERLLDTYTAGITRKELYEAKMQALDNERVSLQEQIKRQNFANPLATLEPTKNVFVTSNEAQNVYLAGDEFKREKIVKNLLSNLTLRDKNIAQYKFNSPYHLLAKADKNVTFAEMLPGRDSNPDSQRQKLESYL